MKSSKRGLCSCFFIVITMMLLNCGASHKLVDEITFKDETFTYNSLKKNGLIIGGMSTDVFEISRQERLEYGSTFSNVLIEKLKDVSRIRITNPVQLINRMGQNQYLTMLEDFDEQKALSRIWADTLRVILPDDRYILFAYIVNENVVDQSFDYIDESEQGEAIQTIEYQKTYYVTVDFHLYDLFRNEVVWENTIFNQAKRTESRSTETGCLESCMNNIIQHILFGEPAEISREEVFIKIVEKFAEDIAKT